MAPTWEANQKVRITKTVVDKLPAPTDCDQYFVRDSELMGFAVRVTRNGAKAFILERRIDGKTRRMTLGRYPDLTAEEARKAAYQHAGKIAVGVDPLEERRQRRREQITLADAFQEFLKARKSLKPRTLYDYQRCMAVAFADWQKRTLKSLTKDAVAKRHTELGEHHGPAYANLCMRFLRSLFNFALAHYEDARGVPLLPYNPVDRLKQTRAWYRVERRRTVIKPHQLPAWFNAVRTLRSGEPNGAPWVVADYLLLMLFTGLRREEGASLRWDNIDLFSRTLTVTDTKNREPLVLPLGDFLFELLSERRIYAANDFVFPGKDLLSHIKEPRPQMRQVIQQSGVEFTVHDLRRTFVTVAESLDISAYALKRLVNHKMAHDVTAGYIISDVERLRRPVAQINDYLVKVLGLEKTPVIALDSKRLNEASVAVNQ